MKALTIGELEAQSGTPRSTIYYYVRSDLLPPAQKSSPTRGLYTDDHLELLGEIRRLKEDGLDLSAIRTRLRPRLRAMRQNGRDLVAEQDEATRRAILRTAAAEFARSGYRQTRIADIIAELRITPQVLYAHFPTKRDLFAACYRYYLDASMAEVEQHVAAEADLGAHHVWRMLGDTSLRAFNPDLLYLAREAAYDDPETTHELRRSHEHMLAGPIADLERVRRAPEEPPFSDELISYALFGAFQTMRMRASWDEKFSWSEVMRANLALYLAALALYDGKLDVAALLAPYEDLLAEVAAMKPPIPPGFDT